FLFTPEAGISGKVWNKAVEYSFFGDFIWQAGVYADQRAVCFYDLQCMGIFAVRGIRNAEPYPRSRCSQSKHRTGIGYRGCDKSPVIKRDIGEKSFVAAFQPAGNQRCLKDHAPM